MRRSAILVAAWAALLAVVDGCGRRADDEPAPRRSLAALLAERYASPPESSESGAGPSGDTAGEGDEVVHKPCARADIDLRGEPHILLAMCGEIPGASHVEGGSVDLFVFRGTADSLVVAAESTGIQNGSNGRPGRVSILRLGRDFWGFSLVGAYLGQGERHESTHWYAPSGNGIRHVLALASLDDNRQSGECLEHHEACWLSVRRPSIDSSDPGLAAFPIVLRDTLEAEGRLETRERRIEFDRSAWRWQPPEPLGEVDPLLVEDSPP